MNGEREGAVGQDMGVKGASLGWQEAWIET